MKYNILTTYFFKALTALVLPLVSCFVYLIPQVFTGLPVGLTAYLHTAFIFNDQVMLGKVVEACSELQEHPTQQTLAVVAVAGFESLSQRSPCVIVFKQLELSCSLAFWTRKPFNSSVTSVTQYLQGISALAELQYTGREHAHVD